MDSNFINILQKLVDEQEKSALTDARKCKAFLADYTKGEYKKECRLILIAVEAGMAKVIDGADELEPCKKAFIRDLEEEGLSSTFAADIVNTLALVLRGDKTVTMSPAVQQTAAPVAANAQKTDDDDDFAIYDGRASYTPMTTKPASSSSAAPAKKSAEAEAEARRRAEASTPAPSASTGGMSAYELNELNNQGLAAHEAGNDAKAVELYRKAAEMGFAAAQGNLGYCYYYGYGVPQNYTKAAEWCRKAAEQGRADAQYQLGYYYLTGEGVPTDIAKAVEWLRKAAEQGDADAQLVLGYCYELGKGVPQNYTKAAEWYRKAAAQGNREAKKKLDALKEKGLIKE